MVALRSFPTTPDELTAVVELPVRMTYLLSNVFVMLNPHRYQENGGTVEMVAKRALLQIGARQQQGATMPDACGGTSKYAARSGRYTLFTSKIPWSHRMTHLFCALRAELFPAGIFFFRK